MTFINLKIQLNFTDIAVLLLTYSYSIKKILDNDLTITYIVCCVTEQAETLAMESKDNDIQYVSYTSELQMPDIMKLIQKDLSEPYSIYTYRYFIHNWPKLCFLVCMFLISFYFNNVIVCNIICCSILIIDYCNLR